MGESTVVSFRREARAALSALVLLLLTLPTPVSPCRAQDDLTAFGNESLGQSSWFWVVPRITAQAQGGWVLSGFYAGLGSCELDLALLDRKGRAAVHARWELVAGQPADYRLGEIGALTAGTPLTLVISGLQAKPSSVAFSLTSQPTGASERELRGSWLQGDIEWIPGLKGKH